MQITYNLKLSMQQSCNSLNDINLYSTNFNMQYEQNKQFVLAYDYCFWLYRGIIEDYNTVSFLISNMNNINSITLRPLYCILRSTLEKYADVLNFYGYNENYYAYIDYLNVHSQFMRSNNLDNIIVEQKKEKARKSLGVDKCNRLTRYYLLGKANSIFIERNENLIVEFNKSLSSLDSEYSQLLHNNVDYISIKSNQDRIKEILYNLQIIAYATTNFVRMYYIDKGIIIDNTIFDNTINSVSNTMSMVINTQIYNY